MKNNSMKTRRILLAAASLLVLTMLVGCGASEEVEPPTGESSSRHALRGVVVALTPDTKDVIIDHEEIPEVMGAMRMGFTVPEEEDRAKMEPGSQIEATLVMENNTMWVEGVTVVGKTDPPPTEKPASGGDHSGHQH
jgi:Cu/Ag efflux protein CusF